MSAFFHIDDDGGVLTEGEITAEDLNAGHLVYRDDDGDYFSADADGQLHELNDELDGYDLSLLDDVGSDPDTDRDEPTPLEEALFEQFLTASEGDLDTAIQQYAAFEQQMAARHGDPAEPETYADVAGTPAGEEYLADWVAADGQHKAAIGDPDFTALVAQTDGDLDRAHQLWTKGREALQEADASTGGRQAYSNFDSAFAAAVADGEIGGGPEKVTPRRPDSMADAMDSWGEELSAENAVKRAARERVEMSRAIRRQESRGRE